MKRLISLCVLFGLCWFTAGCQSSSNEEAPDSNLEAEDTLEADLEAQQEMFNVGEDESGEDA